MKDGEGFPRYSVEYIAPIFWVFILLFLGLMKVLDRYYAWRYPYTPDYDY
jgi:hypothetical protein